ncbi:MAG: DUF2065 domain-containing protein [Thermodesulfobacteriota bacterium]|nr:DUF2065 domain-containing protein [Thermodesulfobacteriota bacterium]
MKFFFCVIGMVLIIEGLPYFAFPEKIKAYLSKVADIPGSTLRILGLTVVIIGLLLVYLGRN